MGSVASLKSFRPYKPYEVVLGTCHKKRLWLWKLRLKLPEHRSVHVGCLTPEGSKNTWKWKLPTWLDCLIPNKVSEGVRLPRKKRVIDFKREYMWNKKMQCFWHACHKVCTIYPVQGLVRILAESLRNMLYVLAFVDSTLKRQHLDRWNLNGLKI